MSRLSVAMTVYLSPSGLLRCWGADSKVADGMLLRSSRSGCLKQGVLCVPRVGDCGPGRSWFPACLRRHLQVMFFANACLEHCPDEDVFCCPCLIRDSYWRRKGQLCTLKTANGMKRSAFSSEQLLRPARKAWVWPVGGRARACLLPSAVWGAGRASCCTLPASAGLLGARRGFRWLCFHAERVM